MNMAGYIIRLCRCCRFHRRVRVVLQPNGYLCKPCYQLLMVRPMSCVDPVIAAWLFASRN